MKKQLLVEDATMALQWLVALALAPFVLLPLFPQRTPFGVGWRALIVVAVIAFSAVMTFLYVRRRRQSLAKAEQIANLTAILDVIFIFLVLLIWPYYIPEIFWVLPIAVIVVATRFGYFETAAVTVALAVLYSITMVRQFGGVVPAQTIVGDTMIRIVFMGLIAVATVYIAQREKQQRMDATILSRVAAAIGSTLEFDALMQTVVKGINEASGLSRCSAFLITPDEQWATLISTTEEDEALAREIGARRIDLRKENAASKVIATREPLVITDGEDNPLLDRSWTAAFGVGAVMVLPLMVGSEVKGVIFVEGRRGKRHFLEREVKICESILSQASAGLENALRYEEESRKRDEALTLYRSSRELTSSLDLEQVAENACRLALHTSEAASCTLFLAEKRRELLEPLCSVSGAGVVRKGFPAGNGVNIKDIENLFALSQRPPALALSRPGESPVLPAFLRAEGTVLMVPFQSHGRMAGMLCLSDGEGTDFSDGQKAQLAAVAGETALAIINARLHERSKEDAAHLASLVQLANAIGTTSDLNTVMGRALDTVKHLFEATSGLIYRIEEQDGTMRYVDSFGYSEEMLEQLSRPPYPATNECWTVAEGRLIGIDDLSVTKLACRTLEKIGRGSTICVGMQAEGRTLGVLHMRSDAPNAFGEEDQQLALAVADQVALALQRAILFEEINRLAITDPLTGVFNVRRLGEVLNDEVSRARRYERPVSFLMVDMDNLKVYNDTLGHQLGDVTLSQVASILDTSTRDVDKVFRYGGDEFCVLLPETDLQEALVVGEKVRRAVAEFHFPGEERLGNTGITISIGVASFPRHCDDEEGLVREADQALYQAKQQGRNSVATAS